MGRLSNKIGGFVMKKVCNQCQTKMIEDCKVNVEGGMYGIKIIHNRVKGFSIMFQQKLKQPYVQIVVM